MCNVFVCCVMLLLLCCCVMCCGLAVCVVVVVPSCTEKRSRVHIQNAPVCAVKTPVSVHTGASRAVTPSLSLSPSLPAVSLLMCLRLSHLFSYVSVSFSFSAHLSLSLSFSCGFPLSLFNDDDNEHSSGWLYLYTRL